MSSSHYNYTALLAPNVNHILLPRNSPCRAIHVESQILPLPLRLGGSLIGSTHMVQFMHWSMSRGGALRVKISRGARLEVQNGTQQDLNEMIDLVNFGGKKIVYMLKMEGFEMGPNKI